MKYIKTLQESIKSAEEYDEAVEFCEEGLIYLLDKGFKLNFTSLNSNFPSTGITVKFSQLKNEYFKWLDIKDDFMSFLLRMESEYYLSKCYRSAIFTIHTSYDKQKDIDNPIWSNMPINHNSNKNDRGFTIRQLDETKFLNDVKMLDITFTIKNKRY